MTAWYRLEIKRLGEWSPLKGAPLLLLTEEQARWLNTACKPDWKVAFQGVDIAEGE